MQNALFLICLPLAFFSSGKYLDLDMIVHKTYHIFGVIKLQCARWLMPRPWARRRAFRDQRRPARVFYPIQLHSRMQLGSNLMPL